MTTLNKYATSEQITSFDLDDFGQPNDSFSSYWYGDFEVGCLWEYNSNKGWFCRELRLFGFASLEALVEEINNHIPFNVCSGFGESVKVRTENKEIESVFLHGSMLSGNYEGATTVNFTNGSHQHEDFSFIQKEYKIEIYAI